MIGESPPVRTIRSWALAAALGVLVFRCDSPGIEQKITPPKIVEHAAPEQPFQIVATDNGFEAPDSIAAGLRHVTLVNQGSMIHEAMLVKLPENKSAAAYVEEIKQGSLFPEGALDYSGVGLTSPGETAEMWLKVDPGRYIIICWNENHATHTPVRSVTVRRDVVDDVVPKEDVVLKLFDYRFDTEGVLKKGVQVLRVETPGPSMHEADIFHLHDGKNLSDLVRWFREKTPGPAPFVALGGPLDSHAKSVVWLRRTFVPGRYVLRCEMPISASAMAGHHYKTHADAGMVQEIDIAN